MVSVKRWFPLLGLILFAFCQPTFAGTYTDPSGFSFTYPDSWVPVSRDAIGEVEQAVPHEVKAWITKNNIDLSRVAVILIRDGHEEFLENLNVVVEGQQITVNDKSVRELIEVLSQQYEAMGVKVDNLQGRVEKVGSRDALVVEYQAQMPGVPDTLRQKQILIPGGGRSYIVTCTAKANSFDSYQPTFDKVLANFQVPAPVAQGFGWTQVVPGVLGGLAGGLIGGLTVLKKMFSGKVKPERGGSTTPDTDAL